MGGLSHHFSPCRGMLPVAGPFTIANKLNNMFFQLFANIEFMIWILLLLKGRVVLYKLWSDNAADATRN